MVKTAEHNIINDGTSDVTREIQALINDLKVGGSLVISKGTYLVSSLFLKSDMNLIFEPNATLLATTDESKYPILPTRVAGVEMDWYVGILNLDKCNNVTVSGLGIINGSGEYWWNKYWGTDYKSGMRKDYDSNGLRWAADYDCMRVRNLVVSESENITISEISSMKSGFWNVHILYSDNVRINNIKILENGDESPSTDGIDIDSSSNVIVENCTTSCHDDSICIKSGRDGDGYFVGKPCHDIIIRNCEIRDGMGMTIGSEVSGGVYNVKFENIKFIGTDCGFRMKSSNVRKGYIKDITVENIEMTNVRYPFNFNLNWNPQYSLCQLPNEYQGRVPQHWKKLLMRVPSEVENTKVENITIRNVSSNITADYHGTSRAFQIEGFEDQPIRNVIFKEVSIEAKEFGQISYVKDISFQNTDISITSKNDNKNDQFDNR
ncbi:MAG: glycoside hydrolase family 28 protein [Coprobacillaceae bacterium]